MDCSVFLVITLSLTTLVTGIFGMSAPAYVYNHVTKTFRLTVKSSGFNCYNCVQIKSELSIFDDIITDKVHSLLPDNFTDIVKNNNCIDLTSSTPLVSCKTACFSLTPSLDLTQYTGSVPPAFISLSISYIYLFVLLFLFCLLLFSGPTGPIVGEELDLDLILKSLESAEISIRGCADRFFSSYLKVDMSTVSGNISSTDGCLNIPDSKIFEISFAGNICYCTTEKCNSKPVGRKPPQSLPLATGRIYSKQNRLI